MNQGMTEPRQPSALKHYRLQDDPNMLDEHGLVNLELGDELPKVKVVPERLKDM